MACLVVGSDKPPKPYFKGHLHSFLLRSFPSTSSCLRIRTSHFTPGGPVFTTLRVHHIEDFLLRDLLGELQGLLPHGEGCGLVEVGLKVEPALLDPTIEITNLESLDRTVEPSCGYRDSNQVTGPVVPEVSDLPTARHHALLGQSESESGPRQNGLKDVVRLLCPVIPNHTGRYGKRPWIYNFWLHDRMILSTIYSSLVISTKLPNLIQKASPTAHL